MKWVLVFFFAISLQFSFAYNQFVSRIIEPKNPDSLILFVSDYQYLKDCDSLYSTCFIQEKTFHPWAYIYEFGEDSIPTYLDTTYKIRLAQMDVKSPFSFQYNEAVLSMINFYATRRPKHIARALETKELYFPLFEEMLDKYHLPMELKYLAIVESALNPSAKSRAGAVGLWQFMPGTGQMYGLHINSKVDDRMDIYKSTEAACQHFADLYSRYQDWNLVLAAYNSGSGNVNKAIRRAGNSTDYWEIRQYLPKETQSYVPAFIAVNYMMQYADAHNVQPVQENTISYFSIDTIMVTKSLRFTQIADWLDLDLEIIKALNPQYKKQIIPASESRPYVLTLPNSKIGEFILNKELIISGILRRDYESQALLQSQ